MSDRRAEVKAAVEFNFSFHKCFPIPTRRFINNNRLKKRSKGILNIESKTKNLQQIFYISIGFGFVIAVVRGYTYTMNSRK